MLVHGGPQGAWGESWSYRWNAQVFAAAGYVVFMPNPRDVIQAIDARTGDLLWEHQRERPDDLGDYMIGTAATQTIWGDGSLATTTLYGQFPTTQEQGAAPAELAAADASTRRPQDGQRGCVLSSARGPVREGRCCRRTSLAGPRSAGGMGCPVWM